MNILKAAAIAATALLPAALAGTDARGESLRVGFRCDAPPFSYLRRGCSGQPDVRREATMFQGYIADVCNAVFREMRVDVEPVEVDAARRLDMLDGGDGGDAIDVLCDPTTVTSERYARFWFSQVIFLSGVSYVFLPGGRVVPPNGLAQKAAPAPAGGRILIGYVVNTTAKRRAEQMIRNNVFGVRSDETETVAFHNHREGIAAICDQRLDFYVADRDVILWFLNGREFAGCNAATSGRFYSYEPYAIVVARQKPELAVRIQRAVYEVVRRGGIEDALNRNFRGGNVSRILRELIRLYRIPPD